jgi:hypothetical protein
VSALPKTSPRPAAIEVHIDTLVVDGLNVRNAGHLGAVVQNELETLLAANGLGRFARATAPGAHLEFAALRTPAMRTSRAPHASDAGEKIARAIYGGLRA